MARMNSLNICHMKNLQILFLLCLINLTVSGQISIAEARTGALGTDVTVKGIVTNGSELGVIRYMQDNTAGIGVYDNNFASSIAIGDSILVTGTLYDFNGLLELSPISSLTVLNSGNPLPTPETIGILDLTEDTEGELVEILNASFQNPGGTFSNNTSYNITTSEGIGSIYIRNGSALVGLPIPFGDFTIAGIGSQYQTFYQLLPRTIDDLIFTSGISIVSPITTSNITTLGFSLQWQTDVDGSTEVAYGLTPELELGIQSNASIGTSHSFPLFGLDPGTIYYCQPYSVAGGDTAFAPIRPFGTRSLSSGDIKVYFNTDVDTSFSTGLDAVQLYLAIDDTLIAYLDRAEESVDLTIYDFINDSISNISAAINAAKERGVRVRFISDGSLYPTNTGVTELSAAIPRIESPTEPEYNIMHNKFVIIDANHSDPLKPIVWTGATNWTDRQINRDNNDVVIIQDQTLARAYTLEFEEMWGSTDTIPDPDNSRFGPYKLDNTPHEFNINGKRVECYFSPSDGTNSKIINTINSASQEIAFASMIITREDLAEALIAQHNNGIIVRGITNDTTSTSSQYPLLNTSLPEDDFIANLWPIDSIIMHHKYLIADMNTTNSDPLVWVGSHNWTNSANNTNDENSLVIHDATIANLFYQEFNALFNQDTIPVVVPDSLEITFRVDMTQQSVSTSGVHLVTDYNAWNPTSFQMNSIGNGIYEYVLEVPEGTSLFYRFANGINSTDAESVPVSCAVMATDGAFARLLNAESEDVVLSTVCFGECTACIPENVTNINAGNWGVFPNPVNKGDRVNARIAEAGYYDVQVRDIKNSIVHTSKEYLNSGVNELPFQFQHTGNYIVTLTSASVQLSFRMTVKD